MVYIVCIIKKKVASIGDKKEFRFKIVYKGDYFPFKVDEDYRNPSIEMVKYLRYSADWSGPGFYYVYSIGGLTTYRKYFYGIIKN